MRIAVIGANGQLGSEIETCVRKVGFEPVALYHRDIEVTDPDSIERALCSADPQVVINTAAYHNVDSCEKDPFQTLSVNVLGAHNVAKWCGRNGRSCALISTDYVFSGEKGEPYVETDVPAPVSVYGASKFLAERLVSQACSQWYVFRVSGVFGVAGASGKGGNFVDTVVRIAGSRDEARFIADMHTSVTYAPHAAAAIIEVIRSRAPHGIYHAASGGAVTWFQFARRIVESTGLSCRIDPMPMSEFPFGAPRPKNSVLDVGKLQRLGIPLPSWEQGLSEYLAQKIEMEPR